MSRDHASAEERFRCLYAEHPSSPGPLSGTGALPAAPERAG
jgi:hypothetical protein